MLGEDVSDEERFFISHSLATRSSPFSISLHSLGRSSAHPLIRLFSLQSRRSIVRSILDVDLAAYLLHSKTTATPLYVYASTSSGMPELKVTTTFASSLFTRCVPSLG